MKMRFFSSFHRIQAAAAAKLQQKLAFLDRGRRGKDPEVSEAR